MPETAEARPPLTSALEDYLETIYELVRDKGVARVKDIARARGVKAGSVSPALRRLSEQGLIRYERREFVALLPAGEAAARKVFGRHELLTRFLNEVLLVPPATAERDACIIEHELSDETMDRMVRFFEFTRANGGYHDSKDPAPGAAGWCIRVRRG